MKKKGFTLIELLAVIVILAIIALIAVPVILNVIEKSKIGAAEQSAQGYVDAVEKQIVTNKVKNENLIEEGEYTKSQLDEKNVKIKGEITNALVVIGAKGRVTQARFCINGYSIDYDGKKATKNSEANYCNEMNSIVDTCPYELNQVFNFDYTGDIQEFTPECEGNYKLEVWGAQGGCYSNQYGGKGGYSKGELKITNIQKMYIVIGGMGQNGASINGGYNGGGSTSSNQVEGNNGNWSSGGGATHIALKSGLLSSLESYKSDILIVAGGGGGQGGGWSKNWYGGAGGGYNGGKQNSSDSCGSRGATQSSSSSACCGGGTATIGGFGLGANGDGSYPAGGGGGGWYGGGSGCHAGGGGGSGYIGNPLLLNKEMYMYNQECIVSNDENTKTTCTSDVSSTPTSNYAKEGNGYARITYLGK